MKTTRFIIVLVVGILVAGASLAATGSFTLLSPAGGEQWVIGTTHTIDFQENQGSLMLNSTDTIGIYLEGVPTKCVSGLPCPIKLGSILYHPPFTWTVGKDANGRNIPAGQYVIRIVYPSDETDPSQAGGIYGTSTEYSSIHAEGTSNTFQIVPVPTATPRPTAVPGATKTPTPIPTATKKPVVTTIATACTDGATITSSDLPATISLAPGATQVFHTNVTNNGNTNWYDGTYYQLINNAPQNLLSPPNGHLPNAVSANGTVAWSFAITAPQTPGSYPINLQMVHTSGGQYIKSTGAKCAAPTSDTPFGQVLATTIQVIAPSSTPSPSTTPIPPTTTSNWFMDNLMLLGVGAVILIALILGAWWLIKRNAGSSMMPPPSALPPTPPTTPPITP